MIRSRLGGALAKLQAGEIGFREFADATGGDWNRMAADVARSWRAPPGVDEEDVRQEFLLAIYERRLLDVWDGRQSLEQFVTWQSYTHAKRWLHRQRNALRRSGKAPGRYPISFSSLQSEVDDGHSSREERGLEGIVDAEQLERVEAAELAAGVRLLLGGDRERHVFDVLIEAGGCAAVAAIRIWDRPELAVRCEVGSEEEAVELVARVVDELRDLAASLVEPAAASSNHCDDDE